MGLPSVAKERQQLLLRWSGARLRLGREVVAAARLVRALRADMDAIFGSDDALAAARRLAADDADRQLLGDVFGLGKELRHRVERLAAVVLIEARNHHAQSAGGEVLHDRNDLGAEELHFVDAYYLDVGCEFRQYIGRFLDHGRDHLLLRMADDRLGIVAAVDARLEDLDLAPGDHRSPQPPDQLLGLPGEHRTADDFDGAHVQRAAAFRERKRIQRSASTPSLPGRASKSASRRSAARSAKRRDPAPAMPPCSVPARSIDLTMPAMLTHRFCWPGTWNPCTPMRFSSLPSVVPEGASTRASMSRFIGGFSAGFLEPLRPFGDLGACGGTPPMTRKSVSSLIAACAPSPTR